MTTWTLHDGRKITLLTPKEFLGVPDGTILYDIMGEPHIKGVDKIDDDTRGGHLAYGTLAK